MKRRSIILFTAPLFIAMLFEVPLSAQLFRRTGRCRPFPNLLNRIQERQECNSVCGVKECEALLCCPIVYTSVVPFSSCATSHCTVRKSGGYFYVNTPNDCGDYANCKCSVNMKLDSVNYQCYQPNSSADNVVTVSFDTTHDGDAISGTTRTVQLHSDSDVADYYFKQDRDDDKTWLLSVDYDYPSGPVDTPTNEVQPDMPNYEYITFKYKDATITRRFPTDSTNSATVSFAGFSIQVTFRN